DGPKGAWPEFAEYDCYACHHDLKVSSWRQKRDLDLPGSGPRPAGSSPWGTWYFSMPALLAKRTRGGQEFRDGLARLEGLMGKTEPDRGQVVVQGREVLGRLPNFAEPPAVAAAVRHLRAQLAP